MPRGFPCGTPYTLDHGLPPPRPATLLRHSCAVLLPGRVPRHDHHPTRRPEAPTSRLAFKVSDLSVLNRLENIDSIIHSTTPVGLALGPDSPGDDERGPGTLGHPAGEIPTPLSLLMPAFSLPSGPRPGSPAASPQNGTLSYPSQPKAAMPRLRWCA